MVVLLPARARFIVVVSCLDVADDGVVGTHHFCWSMLLSLGVWSPPSKVWLLPSSSAARPTSVHRVLWYTILGKYLHSFSAIEQQHRCCFDDVAVFLAEVYVCPALNTINIIMVVVAVLTYCCCGKFVHVSEERGGQSMG